MQTPAAAARRNTHNDTENNDDGPNHNATTNGISENGSFIWAQSTVTFTDVPLIQTTGLTDLNYSDATDSSEIYINVTVPSTEGPGVRTSTITFTVSLGDGDTY